MVKFFLSLVILFCFNLGFFTIEAQQCGRGSDFTGYSFGGVIAEEGEWPWNVAFVHRQEETFFCGGTLISAKHVLSAAHCFQNKRIPFALSPFLVEALLGKFNLSIENETGSKSSLVSEIVIHPDWKFDQEKFDADLSIVVLERTVTLNIFIRPICLPTQSDNVVTGTGTVVGWGKSETSGRTHANVPSKLEVPAVNDSMCLSTFPQLAYYSSTRTFCGGFINLTKAPCLGDSGGGFYLLNKENFWEIRGIVSGSLKSIEHGCDINKFALFTHVAKFAEWINEKMKETMTVDWNFVDFKCVEYPWNWTHCSTTFDGPMTRNLKIRTNFSSHESKNSPIDVAELVIDFSNSTHVFSGIGEEFPDLRRLWVHGSSIKFIERKNFANLTQLYELRIIETSVEFLPEDLITDLPNLTRLDINDCPELKRLPEKFFMNQRKLETLYLIANGLTILQKDLLKNNLLLEKLDLRENRLTEIYVDFTRLPAVKWINLRDNECISQEWKPKRESIQSLQDKINRKCRPTNDV